MRSCAPFCISLNAGHHAVYRLLDHSDFAGAGEDDSPLVTRFWLSGVSLGRGIDYDWHHRLYDVAESVY